MLGTLISVVVGISTVLADASAVDVIIEKVAIEPPARRKIVLE
jgi:hypothetical protein